MKDLREMIAERLFLLSALASSSLTIMIMGFMVFMGYPLLRDNQFLMLLVTPWEPNRGVFGIYPMIAGTGLITLLSLAIAFPLSLGSASLAEIIAPKNTRSAFRRLIWFMTGMPTVVYGFVGIFLLVPLMREFFESGSGMCILSASLLLGLLISPTMILFFCDSFDRVPRSYLDAADAMGASSAQKLIYVILPASRKGIVNGSILAFGRAAGDTLVSLMIAGNSVQVPGSVLEPARTLTAHIALVMAADYESPEFRSIFACGVVLYLFTIAVTLVVRYMGHAWEKAL